MRIWIEVAPANKLYYIGYASLAVLCAGFGAFSFWYVAAYRNGASKILTLCRFYYTRIVPRSAMALHRTFSETVMRYRPNICSGDCIHENPDIYLDQRSTFSPKQATAPSSISMLPKQCSTATSSNIGADIAKI